MVGIENYPIISWLRFGRKRRPGYVGRYVVMPDHIHLFAAPGELQEPLENWIRFWKSQFNSPARLQRASLAGPDTGTRGSVGPRAMTRNGNTWGITLSDMDWSRNPIYGRFREAW